MYRETALHVTDERSEIVDLDVNIKPDETGRGYQALVEIESDEGRWEFGVVGTDRGTVAEQLDEREPPTWMSRAIQRLGLEGVA